MHGISLAHASQIPRGRQKVAASAGFKAQIRLAHSIKNPMNTVDEYLRDGHSLVEIAGVGMCEDQNALGRAVYRHTFPDLKPQHRRTLAAG